MAMINTEWMLLLITGWVFSIARKEYELGNGGIEGWRDGGMGKTRVGSLDMQSYNTQTTCQPGHAGPPSPLPLSSSVQGATQSFWYEVWVMDLCLVQRFLPLFHSPFVEPWAWNMYHCPFHSSPLREKSKLEVSLRESVWNGESIHTVS